MRGPLPVLGSYIRPDLADWRLLDEVGIYRVMCSAQGEYVAISVFDSDGVRLFVNEYDAEYQISLDGGFRTFGDVFLSYFGRRKRPSFCDNFFYYWALALNQVGWQVKKDTMREERARQTKKALEDCLE